MKENPILYPLLKAAQLAIIARCTDSDMMPWFTGRIRTQRAGSKGWVDRSCGSTRWDLMSRLRENNAVDEGGLARHRYAISAKKVDVVISPMLSVVAPGLAVRRGSVALLNSGVAAGQPLMLCQPDKETATKVEFC